MAKTKLYSPSTRGFYDRDISGNNIPADAREIPNEEWKRLLQAHATGLRIEITPDANGNPIAAERVPPAAEVQANARAARNVALAATDGLVARHRDQAEMASKTTLTADQYRELLTYRAGLRTAPEKPEWPALPVAPAFLRSTR
jgi:hypothetical protein